MISFYILSTRFFLKHRGLSDTRVAPITIKMQCNLLKFLLVWDFIIKQWVEFSLIFFRTAGSDGVIKTREIFNFPLVIINPSFFIAKHISNDIKSN